jgi:hypothetical protein
MNPFEFAIAIVAIVFGYKLIATRMRQHHVSRNSEAESVNVDLRQRLEQLEERVRVLERIVTDERYDLKQQFKDLES